MSGEANIIIKIMSYIRCDYSVREVGVVMDHPTPPTTLVHNHTHFTFRILIPDIADALDYNTSFS